LFNITNAAITPGTHPQIVSNKVMMIDPHPWSMTARGGNMIASITLNRLIFMSFITIKRIKAQISFWVSTGEVSFSTS
jgi:hypothetical protein